VEHGVLRRARRPRHDDLPAAGLHRAADHAVLA
jgi:hypothetical protein